MGREENYRNPYGSIPGPDPKDIPKTLWASQTYRVAWQGVVSGTDTAIWQSPTFDLRPDLRSAQSMKVSGVPIWDTSARLYIQFFGLSGTDVTNGLRMEYREYANTTFGEITQAAPNRAVANPGVPNQIGNDPIVRVMPRTDITSELMLGVDQPDSAIVVFETLGEGYPVRYWRVELLFTYYGGVPGPALAFQAAMY